MTQDSSNIRLGPGGEFDLIRRILAGAGSMRGAEDAIGGDRGQGSAMGIGTGPGDDCALLVGDGFQLAVSTDISVENVHFRRDWLTDEEIGYRAAAAALSDLAAVAAKPLGVLVSLAAPADVANTVVERAMAGVLAAAREVGAALLGGDLARSSTGLVLDVVVLGTTPAPVLRRGALHGDEIWVTGELGAAAAAVLAWSAGKTPGAAARRAYAAPRARIREALWLAERQVLRAMIDISDGLAGDLRHLAAASEVAIVVETESIPVHPAARSETADSADALSLALAGGEDYELCFAARPGVVERHAAEFEAAYGVRLTRVGTVEAGAGVWSRGDAGDPVPLPLTGYSHFRVGE